MNRKADARLSLSVIVLTCNEARHIQRGIDSVKDIAVEIFVVDSGSTDETIALAESLGARVFRNPWPGNQALQFNWALDNLPIMSEWVLRLDAFFVQNATLLTAPTEKGFLPTAILEEVGIIGTLFFVTFLFLIFRKLYLDENIIGFGVFSGFLIVNMGEMMFFSFGGGGLFCWSMVGASIAVGYRHQFIRRQASF